MAFLICLLMLGGNPKQHKKKNTLKKLFYTTKSPIRKLFKIFSMPPFVHLSSISGKHFKIMQ